MTRYTYIVVDDEPIIRMGIIKKIGRLQMPLHCVGEAGNGVEGLALIEAERPDIIISDMKMPLMDGAEFLARVSECHPAKPIIVLSSYKSFDYISVALERSAVGYVLKPFSPADIQKQLSKAIERIEAAQSVDDMQERIGALEERMQSRQWMSHLLYPPGEEEPADRRGVALLSVRGNGRDLLTWLESRCREDQIPDLGVAALESTAMKGEFFVIAVDEGCGRQKTAAWIESLAAALSRREPLYLCILTSFQDGVDGLHRLYQTAGEAFLQLPFSQKSCLLRQVPKPMERIHADKAIQDMFLAMRYRIDDAPKLLEGFFAALEKADATLAVYAAELTTLLGLVDEYAVRGGVEPSPIMDRFAQRYFFDSDSGRIRREISGYITLVLRSLQSSRSSQLLQMEQIREYIDRNYRQKLTLESISKEFYLNPSYLSYLFKLKTQESFSEYLIRVRLQKARELLATTTMGVENISDSIGYRNPKYFYRIFKKHTGLTPVEYRNKHTSRETQE